ncbi:MAG TPA: FliA/WhiG family RNA polymerase sigma factor [Planctomycetota bacterium]|nr:FliA/WhiG family RNA polymerase sigma factor [Planctomycetota bacterium]
MQETRTLKSVWEFYRASPGPETKQELIMSCMPLVRHVVSRLAAQLPGHLDREDLLEAGVFGMIDAIERYNPREDAKFETYAVLRVRGAVLDELRSRDFVPRSLRKKARQIRQARAALIAENDCAPSAAALAAALNLNESELEHALAEVDNMATVTSLYDRKSGGTSSDEGFRIVDLIPDPKSSSPAGSMELEEKKRMLATAISELPEQERIVITLYYYENMLLKQIGELFSITESRVSQIRSRALMLLKLKMRQLS